jgi:hypothetical protein
MDRRLHPDDWDEEDITWRHGHAGLSPDYDRVTLRRRSRSADRRPNVVLAPYPDPHRRHSRDGPEVVDALDDIRDEIHRLHRGRSQDRFRDRSPGAAALAQQQLIIDMQRDRERLERDRIERDRLEREIEIMRRNGRGSDRESDRQLADMRLEIRRLEDRLKEDERHERKEDWELSRLRDDNRRRSEERRRRDERESLRSELERKEHEKREEERLLELKLEKRDRDQKERDERLLAELTLKEERKLKDKKAAEAAAIAEYNRRKQKEKDEEEDMRRKFEIEAQKKKEKEKREREDWKLKFEAEEREKKEKQKKHEDEIQEEMRKRLSRFGFQANQLDVLVDPKAKDKHHHSLRPGDLPSSSLVLRQTKSSGPKFIKIHKDHIDIETLTYYNLKWEWDSPVSDLPSPISSN